MNKVVIRDQDGVLRHYGIKGMKWDDEKKKKKSITGILPSIFSEKTTYHVVGAGGRQSDQNMKLNNKSPLGKAQKKIDDMKKSIFKEKTTYRTVGIDKANKLVEKNKKKTLANILPGVFKEKTTLHTVGSGSTRNKSGGGK